MPQDEYRMENEIKDRGIKRGPGRQDLNWEGAPSTLSIWKPPLLPEAVKNFRQREMRGMGMAGGG